MADDYNQYTKCGSSSSWQSLAVYMVVATAVMVAWGVGLAIAAGWCAMFWLGVLVAVDSVVACNWWLYVRLVCLGGDRSAVAMLVSVEPSTGKTGLFSELDTDYSINLLLYPNLPGVSQAQAEVSVPYGELIKEQDNTKNDLGFFGGESAADLTGTESAVLHAEFEGAGVYDFSIGAAISYGLAVASFMACVALPPPWGWIVGGILAFLAFLAWLFGYLFGASDYAGPGDVTGTPSEFHQNEGGTGPNAGLGADLLYVYGTWVFDSLHEGWNELHPIKKCTVIGRWTGAWPADIPDVADRFDKGFDDARTPGTNDAQQDPHNKWEIHPYIDGCGEYAMAGAPEKDDDPPEPPH